MWNAVEWALDLPLYISFLDAGRKYELPGTTNLHSRIFARGDPADQTGAICL